MLYQYYTYYYICRNIYYSVLNLFVIQQHSEKFLKQKSPCVPWRNGERNMQVEFSVEFPSLFLYPVLLPRGLLILAYYIHSEIITSQLTTQKVSRFIEFSAQGYFGKGVTDTRGEKSGLVPT